MLSTPTATPVTTPDPEPTVTTEELPELQELPPALASAVELPIITHGAPVIGAGGALTVTVIVEKQPVPIV